jgi:gliding motility-associated-like protein
MKISCLILVFFYLCVDTSGQDYCLKAPFVFIDAIKNPSFEVPQPCNNSDIFDRLTYPIPGWLPSSKGFVAYLHECFNFKRPPVITSSPFHDYFHPVVPQPIPDGKGVIVLVDWPEQETKINDTNHIDIKSYVFSTLKKPLKKDSLYQFVFYTGFGRKDSAAALQIGYDDWTPTRSPEPFSLFGLSDSMQINPPLLHSGQQNADCPSSYGKGWVILGNCIAVGDTGTWVKNIITFTPSQDIQSIALGPSCERTFITTNSKYSNYEFFIDNLSLYTASVPKPVVEITAGSLCNSIEPSTTLHMRFADFYKGSQLQWFKNNILLSNETGADLIVDKTNYGAGWYQCRVQNDSVYLTSDSFHVYWTPMPLPHFGGGSDTIACIGDTIILDAFTDNTASYQWSNGSILPQQKITQSGLYKVIISNACATIEATKDIQFKDCPVDIYVPSAFTPNGDGLNDVFRIRYRKRPLSMKFGIYDRYGQRIFYTTDPDKGWNGKIGAYEQTTKTYVWMLIYTASDGIEHNMQGTVTLIR